ncbi:MAG: hypothetical protein JO307_15020 [Bryobacterales bacterium]|nr:hypothetical protein [Bryobacterales bacterium]MBV9397021.1 hypothetical protein [Bryobacterales bacterium]
MKTLAVVTGLLLSALFLRAADISGTWTANVSLDVGNGTATFMFKQTGETLSGTYGGTFGDAKVSGTVKGNSAEWSFEAPQAGKVVYKGAIEGSKITGTCEYGQLGKGTFTAEKK